jgi:hypothetical protein
VRDYALFLCCFAIYGINKETTKKSFKKFNFSLSQSPHKEGNYFSFMLAGWLLVLSLSLTNI